MKSFEYLQPETIKAASKYLKKNNSSLPFAGGTDLLGLMKDNIFAPDQLVNLKKLEKYNFIEYNEKDGLRIGALTKLSEIENHPIVKGKYVVLAEAISELATLQLRNVGTLGGNICQRPRCFYFRGDYDCIRKGGDTLGIIVLQRLHLFLNHGTVYFIPAILLNYSFDHLLEYQHTCKAHRIHDSAVSRLSLIFFKVLVHELDALAVRL